MCNLLTGEIMSYSQSYSSWRGIFHFMWIVFINSKKVIPDRF